MLEQFSDSRLVAFIVIGPALCGNYPHLLTQPSFFLAGDGAEMFRIITEQAKHRVITPGKVRGHGQSLIDKVALRTT